MPMENDLGSGNDFDMASALDQMSEGLGFEPGGDDAASAGSPDIDPKIDETDLDAATAAAAGKPAEGEDAANPGDTSAAPATVAPPKTWRKEAAELWAQLPPTVQAEVQKREDDMFRGLEAYKVDAGLGKSFKTALEPFLPTLQQHGIDPTQQVASLMQAHFTLALGTPQEKLALFQQIAQDYGIDASQLPDPAGAPFVDPAVSALQSELNSVKSILTAQTRQAQEAKISEITEQINAFAADPKNVHFNDVANDMVTLLQAKAVKTLEEAYEKAIWANPVTRAKELERQTAERDAEKRKEATERAAAAKRASSVSIRPQARRASGTAPSGTLDDTLRETLAEIQSRTT